MKGLVDTVNRKSEKVFLIGTLMKGHDEWEMQESLRELAELATTAGAEVMGEGHQRLEKPTASTYIGPGKAKSLAMECEAFGVDTVIFDDELTPAQTRNLESIFNAKILDRTSLILDIFAQRARTREGKLQVELAQLQHIYPRLTRFWTHLSRQKGGIGMRGDGESQLETDRRRIMEKISKLEADLDIVKRQRQTQRAGRQRHLWPLASIVGYTNAGKSTLLNALTGASTLSEDKLFATLDPTTRRLKLPTNQNILLSDTVGFIRKLPHDLVEAFKATLEEVVEADLLLHVVDISHPYAGEQIAAVNEVLTEINAEDKPTIMVFNKVDNLSGEEEKAQWLDKFPDARFISAKAGIGFDALMAEISRQMRPIRRNVSLSIPHEDSALMAKLYRVGEVLECNYDGPEAEFHVLLPPHVVHEFEKFVIKQDESLNEDESQNLPEPQVPDENEIENKDIKRCENDEPDKPEPGPGQEQKPDTDQGTPSEGKTEGKTLPAGS